ncbi:RT0821/Lpp0805 family surface protein [Indioceanicola profundi]|uniref:RT0821/Lpp0805 family surface protein n=1 Tax=Indioceanicola profundi TaxID=2220096 RepID=UPI001968BEA3|nr:RT0821/Lpp0805 family surface protein [Indioceanicola profundi]
MIRKFLIAVLAVSFLAGCTSAGGQKQNTGAVLGGLAGGLAGSEIGGGSGRLWATGAGVLLGALIGSEIGASLDRADQLALERNTQRAYTAPIGQPIVWDNPNNGNRVVVTPTRQGQNQATGSYCREFQQMITVGGRTEEAYGTACQQPDGSWKIVS